jgi:hypothetical protein
MSVLTLHTLLSVLVQIANKIGLQKNCYEANKMAKDGVPGRTVLFGQ